MERNLVGVALATALAASLLSAGSATAQAEADVYNPTYVTRPDWVERATGADIGRVAPAKLESAPINGAATLLCRVTVEGRLDDCKIEGEAPADFGVGAAAIRLSTKFRMKMLDGYGKPVSGRLIHMPFVIGSPERPVARIDLAPQGTTVMLDPARGSRARTPCPTQQDAKRQCVLREVRLVGPAKHEELEQRVMAVGKTEGISRTACMVGPDRALIECLAPDGLTAEQAVAFTALMEKLRAPEKTVDGAPVSGLLITDFNWASITHAIRIRNEALASFAAN